MAVLIEEVALKLLDPSAMVPISSVRCHGPQCCVSSGKKWHKPLVIGPRCLAVCSPLRYEEPSSLAGRQIHSHDQMPVLGPPR